MRAPGWPVTLVEGAVTVRPPRLRDGVAWVEIRQRNRDWLAPWEATPTGVPSAWEYWNHRQTISIYNQMLRRLRQQARAGTALPFAVVNGSRLVGQVTVSTIVRGAFNSGHVGYWIDQDQAGLGITPTALALVVDHCFGPAGLHRIEANVRPENASSRRVMEKLGFREEGLQRRYLSIDGAYRDHICFALTIEDVPDGLLNRWRAVRAAGHSAAVPAASAASAVPATSVSGTSASATTSTGSADGSEGRRPGEAPRPGEEAGAAGSPRRAGSGREPAFPYPPPADPPP